MAQVLSVNMSSEKGTIKQPMFNGCRITELGLEGDAHAGNWHRQISLLDQMSIDKMLEKGAKNLVPGIFAENITTEGMNLFSLPLGSLIKIGNVELKVTQIGKECHAHCQVYQQVGMCVMPAEGIFTRVIKTGYIRPGDRISVTTVFRSAVITVSDKGYAGTREDKSGPALVAALQDKAKIGKVVLIPDEFEQIKSLLAELCDSGEYDVIFTTGGTGFAPRDVTPEATLAVVERLTPGITEAIRLASAQITPRAMLSRATAGIRRKTLIINLPGSPKAAVECLNIFLPVMGHAVETLRGDNYECATPPTIEK